MTMRAMQDERTSVETPPLIGNTPHEVSRREAARRPATIPASSRDCPANPTTRRR